MKLSDMEKDVREMLLDTAPGAYRFTPEFIINSIYKGVRILFQVRPESRYHGLRLFRLEMPEVTRDNVDEEKEKVLPLDPRWRDALVYYATGKCHEVDSSDTINKALSDDCFAKFNNLAGL